MSTHTVLAQQITKNDIYARLVRVGIDKGYEVIPEFRVLLTHDLRKKNIDLVWVTRKPEMTSRYQDRESLEYWTLHATFEIEACDVRNIEGKEFDRHVRDLPTIENVSGTERIHHFVVLYNAAYDRAWDNERETTDSEIEQRRQWATGSAVNVVDGRDLAVIDRFPHATSRLT